MSRISKLDKKINNKKRTQSNPHKPVSKAAILQSLKAEIALPIQKF